ncbi:MAG: RNA 2',3'-cyclic phosphodiesterase [Kofleriaceae bacterium]
MTEGKRLFVGIRVSVATANGLAQCADQLARRARDANVDVKWVVPANYHLTLKFLGWTHPDLIEALCDRLAAAVAGTAAFKLKTSRLGAFPSLEKASVLWAGVEADGLAPLFTKIEAATTALGFAAEIRPFHPHVTLGRTRETRPLKEVVLPMSEQMFSDTRVESVSLFESETKAASSVYKEISKIAFNQREIVGETAVQRQTEPLDLGDETDDGWPRDRANQGSTH